MFPMNIVKVIGDNVRGYRFILGISQEKLAELANLHRTYIGQVERGEKNLTAQNIGSIATGLGIKPYLLLIEDSWRSHSK